MFGASRGCRVEYMNYSGDKFSYLQPISTKLTVKANNGFKRNDVPPLSYFSNRSNHYGL